MTPRSTPGVDGPGTANDTDRFTGQHVLSMRQYDRSDLERLFTTTDALLSEEYDISNRPLEGKILLSAFFEKSTRTRLSHETAMLRLGVVSRVSPTHRSRAPPDSPRSRTRTSTGCFHSMVTSSLRGTRTQGHQEESSTWPPYR